MNELDRQTLQQIATRATTCDMLYWAKRVEALRGLPGNPYDAEVRGCGNAMALMAAGAQNFDLNRIGNLSPADGACLDELLSWYSAHGAQCRIDLTPANNHPDLHEKLLEHGFSPAHARSVLYGHPGALCSEPAEHLVVRRVRPEEGPRLTQVYLDGFEVPQDSPARAYLSASILPIIEHPAIHWLFALVDGQVAAMAVLSIHESTAYLAGAATLPAFRNHGCQKALLRERIRLAAAAGCYLVFSVAAPASISQQNMERVGLHLAYVRLQWLAL